MGLFGSDEKKIRFAVIGLGYISQIAVLPAFAKAKNCELTALVSDDLDKAKTLAEKYGVPSTYSYDRYEECLRSETIDAVYIALPNTMHHEYTLKAAAAGVHVLCEKPMAMNSKDCIEMIESCRDANVKLMIAYRLHFEAVNMRAVQDIISGKIGEPRMFISAFGQQVKSGDIRTKVELGGGALYDMGIYCLNAARYFFRSEPSRVMGLVAALRDERFSGIDALTGALMEFPNGKLASFVTSIGSGEVSSCTIVGDTGVIKLDPAYDFQLELHSETSIEGSVEEVRSVKSDHFAAELIRFSDSVIDNVDVAPSGLEGFADIRIMEAILESARGGRAIDLPVFDAMHRPDSSLEMKIKASKPPELYRAEAPSKW